MQEIGKPTWFPKDQSYDAFLRATIEAVRRIEENGRDAGNDSWALSSKTANI